MTKDEAEVSNWKIAHEWYDGLDLTFADVPLGDALAYDVLRIIGGLWKRVLDVPTAQLPDSNLPNT